MTDGVVATTARALASSGLLSLPAPLAALRLIREVYRGGTNLYTLLAIAAGTNASAAPLKVTWMPGARAAACELALRATAALVVTQGSGAILADHDAQRLAREALFLLVFGSRPPIREALAGLLTRPG